MARKNRLFAKLASDVDTSGNLAATGIQSEALDTGVTVYASAGNLPVSGNTAGDQAFVTGTGRLYIFSGVGWYNVALINNTPIIQSVLDSDGGATPFSLAQDGTATTITITATDSDGETITYNATADSDFGGLASISQSSNVFTITPFSQDSATASSGTITFTATDGINTATSATQTFTLNFLSQYWDETVLSIGTSSTNGLDNSTFVERSTNAHTVTPTGTPVQTAFHPYLNKWSVEFDSLSSRIYTGSSSDFGIGTNDFSYEGWIYINDLTGFTTYSTGFGLGANFYGSDTLRLILRDAANGNYITLCFVNARVLVSTTTFETGQWNHIAVCRSGNTLSMFYNGTRIATATYTTNINSGNATHAYVGHTGTNTEGFKGNVSNVRFLNGSSAYDATSSSITVPTEPLTAITNTKLLTCQSNRFIDNSSSGHTLTLGVVPKVSAFNPFGQESEYAVGENKGSVYLNGSSYMTLATSPFHMDQSDYTVECWIYPTVLGRYIMGIWSSTSASNQAWSLRTFSGGEINSEIDPGDVQIATSSAGIIKLNQWHHVALTRSGGDFRIFVDGDVVASGSSPGFNMAEGGGFMGIGAVQGLTGSPFTGYISDVYIRKGAAKYTSAFTIPTAPVQNTDATLYLPFDNAGIFDKTGNHTLALNGNVATSTTQTKFADTAMYFDGSGDYLALPASSETDFGTGDFTVEMWANPSAQTNDYPSLIACAASWSTGAFYIRYDNVGNADSFGVFWNPDDPLIIANTTSATGTWHHVAVVRNGTSIVLYVNGTNVGSATISSTRTLNLGLGGAVWIGNNGSAQCFYKGYIENLQILNGVAKYTANFTPPTQEQGRQYQAES